MKNITISVTDKFFARLLKMSNEIGGPASGLGTITRKGLESEIARHEAKMKRTRDYFMQEVDRDAPLSTLLERLKTATPASGEDQVERIKALVAAGTAGSPLSTLLSIGAVIDPEAMVKALIRVSETEKAAA